MEPRGPVVVDAGGLVVAGGGHVRRGRAFRVSGALVRPDDLDAVARLGLQALVDLRGGREDRSLLERWADGAGVRYVWLPIDVAGAHDVARVVDGVRTASEAAAVLSALYERILDDHGAQLVGALRVIASGSPVAFGCAAGKDRTGLVAALLHVLLGVPEDVVAASFASSPPSVERLRPLVAHYVDTDTARAPAFDILLGAEARTIHAALAHLDRRHGGIHAYVGRHGLSDADIERLRADLVAVGPAP